TRVSVATPLRGIKRNLPRLDATETRKKPARDPVGPRDCGARLERRSRGLAGQRRAGTAVSRRVSRGRIDGLEQRGDRPVPEARAQVGRVVVRAVLAPRDAGTEEV